MLPLDKTRFLCHVLGFFRGMRAVLGWEGFEK